MVPQKTKLKDRIRRWLINWLGVVEGSLTETEIVSLINRRMAYREQQLREREQSLDRRYAELERAAAQTTIAIVEVMESMQFARKQWEAINKEQDEE